MRSLLLVAVLALSGCSSYQHLAGTAMLPSQAGNYCEAPVEGACLGCDISCPASKLTSCKAGTSVMLSDSRTAQCTRAAACECR
ncbi:hypothetical protein SRS16CHR_04331 [Variovorax sp. SRS16]|nr:hypothetical protein SRS16CHR_04331 [Variovorax sp. SRS16]